MLFLTFIFIVVIGDLLVLLYKNHKDSSMLRTDFDRYAKSKSKEFMTSYTNHAIKEFNKSKNYGLRLRFHNNIDEYLNFIYHKMIKEIEKEIVEDGKKE